MEPKDKIALLAIAATFVVALVNLVYSIINNRKTAYVNTVTASRMRWIDSLRDKVSTFIAVTGRILNPEMLDTSRQDMSALLRERDTLFHQIILHLNPNDSEDQAIRHSAEQVVALSKIGTHTSDVEKLLLNLRNATQLYLKKEWNRVKQESKSGEQN